MIARILLLIQFIIILALCLVLLSLYSHNIILVIILYLMHVMSFIHWLFIAQHVVDSVPWCADTPGEYYYYEEQAGEEIPEDLQPAEEEREWRADDVE